MADQNQKNSFPPFFLNSFGHIVSPGFPCLVRTFMGCRPLLLGKGAEKCTGFQWQDPAFPLIGKPGNGLVPYGQDLDYLRLSTSDTSALASGVAVKRVSGYSLRKSVPLCVSYKIAPFYPEGLG